MTVLRALSLLTLALLASATGIAAGEAVNRHVLANGLTVLVRENRGAAVVAVSLQVRAGTLFEGADTAGITNFLQRSMLRGTARRTARELAEAAEEIGGGLEASGDIEYAEVRGEALARQWEALLRLIAEVALEPTLPADEVEKERRVILAQIRSRGDVPFQRAFDGLIADLYGAHPYAWPAAGRSDIVQRVTRQALLDHHRAIYRPERLVLAVSGAVPGARVLKVAEALFGKAGAPGAGRGEDRPAVAARRGRRVIERAAQQAQILVGYLGPGLAEPDYPAVKVLGALLGGGMSGRLFVELRDKRGLAYSLGVVTPFRTGPGLVAAYLGTAPQNAEAAEAGVLREIERVRVDGASESELARAKAYLLGSLAMDRRTNRRHAWYMAFFEVVGAGWDFADRYAHALEAVTGADVTAAARRYLVDPTIVVLRPPPGAPPDR